MQQGLPKTLLQTQHAEEKLAANLNIAIAAAQELAKFDTANVDIVEQLSVQFLTNLQEAQQVLTEVIAAQQVTAGTPHQGSPYLARLRAEAAEGHLVAAKLRLQQLQAEQQGTQQESPQSGSQQQLPAQQQAQRELEEQQQQRREHL
mmetsp:Transcript_10128/g.30335  ORF Transcript_10128/g.30335 Transcript_10128/m.30335 type:complete len:147 (+) Transcript_10128:123-563(+)